MKLQNQIEALQAQLDELKSKVNEKPKGRYKPKYGGLYEFIDGYSQVSCDKWDNLTGDNYRYAEKNVFPVGSTAQAVLDAKKAIHKIIGDWEPDWDDGGQAKWYNYYNYDGKKMDVTFSWTCSVIGRYYYPTREKAIEAQPHEEVLRKAGL